MSRKEKLKMILEKVTPKLPSMIQSLLKISLPAFLDRMGEEEVKDLVSQIKKIVEFIDNEEEI